MLISKKLRPSIPLCPAIVVALVLQTGAVQADMASWAEPDIDNWFYINGSGGGARDTAPTWGGLVLNNNEDAFEEGSSLSPSRSGSTLLAFETNDQVTSGNLPSQYSISSVTLTVKMEDGTNGNFPFNKQIRTPTELLNEVTQSGVSVDMPIELFGVGFRNGFEGFALGDNQSGLRFQESFNGYFASGYNAYPVIRDGAGNNVDVSNNYTGGFSATEASSITSPFAATPWSVGDVPSLLEGQTVQDDTTFVFEIDLAQPGVETYLQQGLAEGVLGFFLTSMHPADEPGVQSDLSYPQWYTKENNGSNAQAPTLAIEYSIVTELLPGDYDGDGDVDPVDYATWVNAYGTTVAQAGEGADGNNDGLIDAADYTVWRDSYNAAVASTAIRASLAISVPEPSSATYAFLAFLLGSSCFMERVNFQSKTI